MYIVCLLIGITEMLSMHLSLRLNEQMGGKFVKENLKFAWIASWFALVGQLMIFTIISIKVNGVI